MWTYSWSIIWNKCQQVHPTFNRVNLEDIFWPQTQNKIQQIFEQIHCRDDMRRWTALHTPTFTRVVKTQRLTCGFKINGPDNHQKMDGNGDEMRGKVVLSSVEGRLGIIIDEGGFAGIDQASHAWFKNRTVCKEKRRHCPSPVRGRDVEAEGWKMKAWRAKEK